MRNLKIHFSGFADDIGLQIKKQGFDSRQSETELFQKYADAITLLLVKSLITPTESAKARKRLFKLIQIHVNELNND